MPAQFLRGGAPPALDPCTILPPSLTSSPLNRTSRTIRGIHVVHCASNILNILHFNFQHPINHRCLGRLCKGYWNRPFQQPIRCRHRTGKFSWGYLRTSPGAREGVQGLSRRKSETDQLPQPGGERHPGVLGHSRRGGQPRKSHISFDNSYNAPRQVPFPPAKALFVGIDVLLSVCPFNIPFNKFPCDL